MSNNQKPIKVLHLARTLGTGGIEQMLVDLVNYQVNHCDVSILVTTSHVDPVIVEQID